MAKSRQGDVGARGVRAVPGQAAGETELLRLLRLLVLALVLFGAVGMGAELVLLEHTEDTWQWVPLVALAAVLLAGGALAARPRPATVRAFQAVMALCVAAGVVGMWLHYAGNVEFEREMEPGLRGLTLFWQAMRGATPALAPGSLAHLGLVGLVCTYRHPALRHPEVRPGASGAPSSPSGDEMNRTILPAVLCAVLAVSACGGSDEQAGTAEQAGAPAAAPAAPAAMDTTAAAPAPAAPAAAPAASPASGAFLDPNAASREELLTVPHMTPALADAVIAGRPHADMRSVDRVLTGLSEPQRDEVYGRLWKPLDLNKATAQEIELIPRVGGRMRHEFEEYRPYDNIARFRREIGKYVDEAEVARLERYVTIGS